MISEIKSDLQALMSAILRDPKDIGARLAYADELMEQYEGTDLEQRGQFIKLQCEISQIEREILTNPQHDSERDRYYSDLLINQRGLIEAYNQMLLSDMPEGHLAHKSWLINYDGPKLNNKVWFDNGFPHSIFCDCDYWQYYADHFINNVPLEIVTLASSPEILSIEPNKRGDVIVTFADQFEVVINSKNSAKLTEQIKSLWDQGVVTSHYDNLIAQACRIRWHGPSKEGIAFNLPEGESTTDYTPDNSVWDEYE